MKVDNYPYDIVQMNINYDGTLFIPISKINELRRNLFEKLESDAINSYKHKTKEIKLPKANPQSEESELNISFYTNNLNHLEKLDSVKRVYLEIPHKENSLMLEEEKYNINYMVNFIKRAVEISYDKGLRACLEMA